MKYLYPLTLIFILSVFAPLTGANIDNVKPIKVACIGNSITYGAGVADRENNAYPKQLQNMLGDQFKVQNFGISGRTLLNKGDLPYTESNEYQQALAYSADIAIIMLGTNDSKIQNRIYLNEFIDDYKSLISSFKEQNNEARIILMLPPPSFVTDTTSIWDPIISKEIIPKIQEVAYDFNLELINLHHLFVNQSHLLPDGVHPSSLGATIIAQRLYEAITQESISYNLPQSLNIKDADTNNFHGFHQTNFSLDGNHYKIVSPKRVLPDKPWIWRARFFGHEPQTDIALLERGFHVVYCDVSNLYGNPEAVSRWNKCYKTMTAAGMNSKPALEGMSRGGLIIYNWAAENLDKVSCIYADAPVLDARSWPGNFGKGKGSKQDWERLKKQYKFNYDSIALKFTGWPIDNAKQFAKFNIPMLHVCGEDDTVVPISENTEPFAKTVRDNGGNITTIYKPGVGHHPHSLPNPTVIVDFILRATGHKVNLATLAAPGAEYRSGAGWKEGKGWWKQASQIDSLCQVSKDIDLLLIGNSITQGWGGSREWVTSKPGQNAANQHFANLNWIGAGISGDKTQQVNWRLKNGNYNACQPKFVVLTIGVNNFSENNASEIVEGLKSVISNAEQQFPNSTILFFGPLPAGIAEDSKQRIKYKQIHHSLSMLSYPTNILYYNLEQLFLDEANALNSNLYSNDGIHLKEEGYNILAQFIAEELNRLSE